jgi:Cytochrome b5-like Heme/Steroid binding domain
MPPQNSRGAPALDSSSKGADRSHMSGSSSSGAPAQPSRDLWYIHGKAYDLTSFIDQHPGGRNNLLETRGQNATELFESVHVLSKRNVHSMLSKFEVSGAAAAESPFTYAENGAYREIARRVHAMFGSKSYKANTLYFVQLAAMIALYAVGMYYSFVRPNPLVALLTGGWLMIIFFYGAVHDASHFALSKHAWVNTFWSVLSCHWGFWHSNIWFQHHW